MFFIVKGGFPPLTPASTGRPLPPGVRAAPPTFPPQPAPSRSRFFVQKFSVCFAPPNVPPYFFIFWPQLPPPLATTDLRPALALQARKPSVFGFFTSKRFPQLGQRENPSERSVPYAGRDVFFLFRPCPFVPDRRREIPSAFSQIFPPRAPPRPGFFETVVRFSLPR